VVAKRAGVFGSLREILDDLAREGFRASTQLVTEALRQVGEG
jgi:predicted nucleic acid-binding protein